MTPEKLNRFWLLGATLLILIIITSSLIIFLNRDNGQPLTILTPETPQYSGQIYIDGAVNQPGAYEFGPDVAVGELIAAAGGVKDEANLDGLHLHLPSTQVQPDFQKIDINRADLWLLQSLPGIGEIKARAIMDYRKTNGRFDNIEQLTNVPGITRSVFDKIKDLISVAD
ncbi:MAG TPA: helix-hairpin-helix domain-containing protein [Dehalococcoidales bacterium]|nr:helix-hairpin-helix domain-containing protein [Dehalococcoidales bacterium]